MLYRIGVIADQSFTLREYGFSTFLCLCDLELDPMTFIYFYLNFVSSDNDIKQNNRNNGIADDTGNRRELVHLHGTYT